MASFGAFNLSNSMINALKKLGYESPSSVQERVIPKALSGQSLICQSETGSGKTHSYLVPIIDKVDASLNRLQAIIIAPSLELARQTYDFAMELCRYFPKVKVKLFSSESEKQSNAKGLSISPMIAIGTPGRLKDMLSSSYFLDLHGVKTLVLDEADMLMELGYFDEVDELFEKLPEDMQTMVFSATLHQGLKEKLAKYIDSSFLYEGEQNKTASKVSHHLVDIRHAKKIDALTRFLNLKNPYLCLVFASKKEDVKTIYEALKEQGRAVTMFSGDLDVRKRKQTLKLIKDNKYQIIVASDLLARGIDIEDVTDVISVDLPIDLSYYYHRAGRTGRFGKEGDSYVFYDSDHTKLPLELMSKGLKFEFLALKGDKLEIDPVGLAPKKKFTKKKELPEQEMVDIRKAKALSRTKEVKPAYKKKQKWAIDRVKNKYRRRAIQKAINKTKSRREE